jgi:hypothetical protein
MKPNSVKHAIWLKQSCLGGFRWFRSVHRSYPIAAERRRWGRIGNLTTKLATEIRLLPRQAPWSARALDMLGEVNNAVEIRTAYHAIWRAFRVPKIRIANFCTGASCGSGPIDSAEN